jgi:outer membrane immunogenic protein
MKKLLLSIVGVTVLAAVPAMAADLSIAPLYKAPPPLRVFSWTGCYIGGYAGYAWGHSDYAGTLDPNSAFGNGPPVAQPAYNDNMSGNFKSNGFTGGGTAGCQSQAGFAVFGVEGDAGAFRLRGSNIASVTPPGHVNLTSTTDISASWIATVRGRVGVAFDRSLFYVTGGAAFTNMNFNQVNAYAIGAPGSTEFVSLLNNRTGWAAGVGWEYAFYGPWSAKFEYLHVDFGSVTGTFVVPVQPVNVFHSVNLKADMVRFGINYRFGGPVGPNYNY